MKPWVIIGGGHRGKPDEKDLKKAARFAQKTFPAQCIPDHYLLLQNTMGKGFHYTKSRIS